MKQNVKKNIINYGILMTLKMNVKIKKEMVKKSITSHAKIKLRKKNVENKDMKIVMAKKYI